MQGVAKDLKAAKGPNSAHAFAMFGTGRKNCVPAGPFEEIGLRLTKVDCMFKMGPGNFIPANTGVGCYPKDSIAIVGAGLRLPGANNLEELWELVSSGVSRAEKIPVRRLDGSLSHRASLDSKYNEQKGWYGNFIDNVDEFDNTFFGISPREALYMDPQQRLLLETAYEALDSSGYLRHHRRDNFDNVGCFIGTTYTEYLENTTSYGATAYSATGTIRAFQNGKISYHFGWSGPSEAIDTACSSSLVAVHRACQAIRAGECPMALAGGVNIITGIQNFLDLGKAGFLSPTGQCKPFDRSGDGYCRADGVGLVVLKSLEQAVAAGDDILGVIPAVATNHGGLSPSITVPHSRAQVELFSKVLQQSGMQARHITYVEAHGTGTQVGDPIEVASIREVLGGDAHRSAGETLCLGSLKANVGHSETAAGIGSLMKVLAMLQHKRIPPLAGFQQLNPKIPPLEPDNLHIPRQILPWDASFRAALVNSYGAAGSNSALICCEAPRQTIPAVDLYRTHVSELKETSADAAPFQYPFFISAASLESLLSIAQKLAEFLRKEEAVPTTNQIEIANVALSLFESRKHHKYRWVGAESNLNSLIQSLQNQSMISQNIFKKADASTRKAVVLVFSGQSKQTVELSPRWYSGFPRLRFHIDKCDEILKSLNRPTILPILFQREPVSDVVALQCGTFAVQYACAKCWVDSGIQVAAVVGHSFGELTAMVVSGVLSLEDGLRLVASRASLMRNKWGPERGAMLAVHTTSDTVRKIIDTVKGANSTVTTLEIACFNGPRSQVVVGSAAEVDLVEAMMSENDSPFRDIQRQRVAVSHGFHSVFTEPLLQDLDDVAKSLTFNKPDLHFETCTEVPMESVSYPRLAEHTRAPVYFSHAITRLEQRLGSCIWLEAGADSPVIPMLKRAVHDVSRHTYVSVKTADEKNGLASATSTLWRESVPATFWGFLDAKESGIKPVWLPPYQFQRQRYWLDWIDSVDQERKSSPKSNTGIHGNAPARLVARTAVARDLGPPTMDFAIGTNTKRFTDIVSGHAIRGHPLCPASMYMECVVMAAQMMKSEISFQACKFENISFQGGLGLSHNRSVTLATEETGEYLAWDFTFRSHHNQTVGAKPGRSTTHAKGRFSIVSAVDLQLLERIMFDRMQQLVADPRAEKLNSGRAYSLFSRVVDYAQCLRGISSITMLGPHAVAQVKRPDVPVDTKESTAVSGADTVMSDTFIQVLGLLINSSDTCPQDEVYIATAIDSIVMQGCDFDASSEWTVYAMSAPASAKDNIDIAGDILVFTKQGRLVMTGTGIRFTRHRIAKLEKLLERSLADSKMTSDSTRTLSPITGQDISGKVSTMEQPNTTSLATSRVDTRAAGPPSSPPTQTGGNHTPPSSSSGDEGESEPKDITSWEMAPEIVNATSSDSARKRRSRLLELISNNCGSPLDRIDDIDSTSIEAFGVDSLSMVELISSMEESFGVSLGEDDFNLNSTVAEVMVHLQATLGDV